ncbi:TetR/AcrR family transcriptional regulator [Micromonospora sp. NPDC048830]|uniref:TetR/AcrR family transcriptional regulator n=1 Tax=Micromonospora sp. NPDC048830 TaxID=3364257 RepID=UPI00371E12EE
MAVAPHPETARATPLPGARPGRDPERAIKRGPRRLSAEVVAVTQRDRLFDGLVREVAEKGYDNARVTDICRAAGVTWPAFYALFAGKEDQDEMDALDAGVRRYLALRGPASDESDPQPGNRHVSWRVRTYRREPGPTVRVLAAPSGDAGHRANTADTQRYWAELLRPAPGDRVLVVTSAVYRFEARGLPSSGGR